MADLDSTIIYGYLQVNDILDVKNTISAPTLTLTQATGTAPMTVTSRTVVTNLNADKLDDQDGSYYLNAENLTGTLSMDRIATGAITFSKLNNIAADTFLGRNTAGSGVIEELSLSTVKTKLGLTGTNSGDQNIFSTIAVAGQSSVVADTTSDTLTLVAGTNVTITTDAGTNTITISASGSSSDDSFINAIIFG